MGDTEGTVAVGVIIIEWHLVQHVTHVRTLFAFLPSGQACFLRVLDDAAESRTPWGSRSPGSCTRQLMRVDWAGWCQYSNHC